MTGAAQPRTPESANAPGRHLRLYRQVHSEWIKLRTVRSTWVSLLLIVVISVGLSALISYVTANAWTPTASLQDRLQYDPVRTAQAGVLVAQFVVGVLGVLFISSEYSSGLIRTSLSAVTHRVNVLVAKAIVLTITLLVTGETAAFSSSLVSRAMLLSHGGRVVAADSPALQATSRYIPVLNLTSPGVLRATLLAGVYVALLGLCGLGLGFILRSGAGAISLFVGVLLVVPIVTAMLPQSISSHFNAYLPNTLGSAMMVVTLRHNVSGGTFLSPGVATSVLALYAVILLVAGAWRLTRTDA